MQAAYDVVLIDSRTGLNEIAGFSIGTVADALVLCCGLNQQNIEGTRYFMKKTGLFNRKKAKPFLVAAGPLPPWQTPEVEERLQALKRALRIKQASKDELRDRLEEGEEGSIAVDYPDMVEIPYHPLAAVRETIFITELPRDSITQAYFSLTNRIQAKLSPEAGEAAHWHLYLLDSLQSPHSSVRLLASEFMAQQLPRLRLLRPQIAPIPSFPTLNGAISIPDRRQEIRWQDLGRIAVAAAASALYTRSAAPFERAWELTAQMRDKRKQRFNASYLIYLQSPTQHSLPEESLSFLKSQPEGLSKDRETLSALCAILAGRRMLSYFPGSFEIKIKNHDLLEQAFGQLLFWRYTFRSTWRWGPAGHSVRDATPHLLKAVEDWPPARYEKTLSP